MLTLYFEAIASFASALAILSSVKENKFNCKAHILGRLL